MMAPGRQNYYKGKYDLNIVWCISYANLSNTQANQTRLQDLDNKINDR